ncbi:16S rRNA (guanine1207-N2)-methyltransferase [Microbacterium sp. W4I4]|uniref:class I SAM-dependent methyltransferase n=1 Tax=Microbacterium sp. W4I4 TaxID=3042295 RepID=UPI00278ADADD|nr:methyltransferase [Microbacterium sp. W4I4]MDQ0614536.1 16S rRNA (guanine1207-N2)-methyltransferase [Microbacterium sp. W4I4]
MPEFDYSSLRRFPDVEAPNLQAWDATDELLVQAALAAEVPGTEIAVIGDGYGAIALALTDAGLHGIRVHQDLVTGRQALAANSVALGLTDWVAHELDRELLDGAHLVLVQLPKALAELEEIADAVARWAAPDATLIAGGRVKHMTLAQNEVLARFFGHVQPQRAERKSRLIMASAALSVPATPPFPISQTHDLDEKPYSTSETTSARVSRAQSGFSAGGLAGHTSLTLAAHGGAFAGAKLDIGTRALLETMATLAIPVVNPHVIDLGCGTGALAAAFARQHPDAVIIATDRSASAVRSARATMAANGLEGRVHVTLDDAGSELPDASADLILLNPPFHLGASVHEGAGQRLIQAAARLLKPGGEVWTVFNSHLDHRRALSRDIGATEQVARTPKFTVTRSIRRG